MWVGHLLINQQKYTFLKHTSTNFVGIYKIRLKTTFWSQKDSLQLSNIILDRPLTDF